MEMHNIGNIVIVSKETIIAMHVTHNWLFPQAEGWVIKFRPRHTLAE